MDGGRERAHADRNKAITVSILMQRVGVDEADGEALFPRHLRGGEGVVVPDP